MSVEWRRQAALTGGPSLTSRTACRVAGEDLEERYRLCFISSPVGYLNPVPSLSTPEDAALSAFGASANASRAGRTRQ